jgi:kinesin family protein C2/C3
VDFALVKSALESLAQGQEGSTSLCNVGVDQAFWTQVEGLREAIGLDKVEQHAKTLEGVVEKLWGRYALVRREDVNGVRLQSELRGLAAKMGDGADINSVLDERDRLRRKVDNLTSLEDKAKGLDVEIRELRSRLEEARRAADEHEGHARSERRARETAETKLRGVERERDDLEREVRDAKEATAAERSAAERMQGDLNKVKKIKVAWLQPAELDELFKRHDRDNSGDISPDEMKSLVEELCGIMEKRMESAQGDAQREAERARHAEEDRARDKQRAKEAEERLTEQIKRLDRELEDSDKAARKQQVQMQERSDKLKARLEAAVEAAKADGEAEVKRTQHEAETHLAAREALHAERYAGLENASAEEVRRRKEREAQLEGELGGEKKRADGLEERLKASDKSLNENKARVARLEKEAAASKEQSVLQEVFALHPRLGSARKALEGLRAEVLQMNEEASDAIRSVGEQLGHFCSFVLPLPHEAPDRVRTEKLTRAQLEQGLKHMMGKYRGAAEQNRRVNLELQGLKGAMRVNCRVRPLRPGPEAEDGTCVHLRGLGALSVLDKNGTREYNFDTVYGPNNKQDKLFDDARPLLQTVMDGFNVSVMAYGATGSGKTYTITGAGISGGASGKHRGLVQRLLEDVFKTIKERAVLVELSLRISMFEIYNEEVRDLLAPSSAPKAGAGQAGSRLPLKISTDRHGSVAIDGLEEYAVDSLAKGLGLVEFGQGVRATAATNINEHSSRSHLLIRLTVHSVDKRTGQRHSGKMYLIDLAGCENVAQSGAEGRALKEAIGINKSLAALHDVMLALANKDQHVPYRNSTLTKVLADSLGGQAKCLMYVMVSPASKDRLVTISALKFAARCKAIVLGEAKSNVDKSVFDELADARDKLEKLQVQMEECAAARRDAEERTSLSAEIIAEASHFEVKLRDLFGLSANGKKDKGGGKKGAGEGHGAGETPGLALGNKGGGGKKGKKGIKAMYLDEASRHLIVKR